VTLLLDTVALPSAHTPAHLHAHFALRADRTTLVHLATQPPLQALRTLYPTADIGEAELQIATLGPGLLGGDHHHINVEAGIDTRVRLTTQSATRILPKRDGLPARADVTLRVAQQACLSWRPLPTIIQADAAYHQTIDLTLADGATAFVWDVLVPGRLARGECFAFAELDAALRVRTPEGRVLAAERLRIAPSQDDPSSLAVLPQPDVVLGSLWVLAPGCPIAVPGIDPGPNTGITELPNGAGLLIRTLAPTAQAATERLERALALINTAGDSL
jgi:urease accessory protein